jgi:phospholipase/carboxylesterase
MSSLSTLKIIQIPPAAGNAIANVVVMHGWGATAQDAAEFMTMLGLEQVQLILPEGPFPHPFSVDGRMWYGLPDPLEDFDFDADFSDSPELQTSRTLLQTLFEQLPDRTGIPLERTIVGGFSQGGAMAIDQALTLPIAGLMVLSGYLHAPIAGRNALDRPVLMTHGQQDQVVPIRAAQMTRDALLATGALLQYEEFNPMGHEISWAVLDRMKQFIHRQLDFKLTPTTP